ncbi:T9SS type A sorting domain-containing protein [Flavobacterium algicola]|uniref:T9SS type A sorting domain-containing protein n=1 Tax=Flavobacterium algicola TaxID=556529 RepID=UPI001EFE19E2|nr:T9SS type A sorting domain-containing protein [Flavobacterium algicola]MCG9793738.1 T9SS type A sorting domain-containing protein [Flavobacterium algicola]
MLINLGTSDRVIAFTDAPSDFVDLITKKMISSTTTKKPYDVLLIRKGTLLASQKNDKNTFKFKVYPNLAKDVLAVENDYAGKYILYNTLGKEMKSVVSTEKNLTITLENLSSSVYF